MSPGKGLRERRSAVTDQFYQLHGLLIRSEIPLVAPAGRPGECDLDVKWGGDRHVGEEAPSGTIVAALDIDERGRYAASETEAGTTIRFFGTCDALIKADCPEVIVYPDPDGRRELIPLLLSGNVLSFVLEMRGACVLHASAVEVDGAAVAFVGPPGAGKSTIAAALVARGLPLVTDDLLRVEAGGAEAVCYPGGNEIRLRPGSAGLAECIEGTSSTTDDGRVGVRPASWRNSELSLGAIVIPNLIESAEQVSLRPLSKADALIELSRYPRIYGWTSPRAIARQFRQRTGLVRTTPVFAADIPRESARLVESADQVVGGLRSFVAGRLSEAR